MNTKSFIRSNATAADAEWIDGEGTLEIKGYSRFINFCTPF